MDREALQQDQFIDGLNGEDIQESLRNEDVEGFNETIERALQLDSINKAKQAKQKRHAGPVVRHSYFEDEWSLLRLEVWTSKRSEHTGRATICL